MTDYTSLTDEMDENERHLIQCIGTAQLTLDETRENFQQNEEVEERRAQAWLAEELDDLIDLMKGQLSAYRITHPRGERAAKGTR